MFEIETGAAAALAAAAAAGTATTADKPALYAALEADLRALLHGEHDLIANAANMSSLMYHTLPDLNWAGVYLLKPGEQGQPGGGGQPGQPEKPAELVLGPFQGKPACVRIAIGKGVCGTAAARRATIVVPDVHAFPGHIACDSASRSELVVPLIKGEQLLGVLDLDSPTPSRFDDADREGCEALARLFVESLAR
jgi:L-methionine (R)-S-oxide reductase